MASNNHQFCNLPYHIVRLVLGYVCSPTSVFDLIDIFGTLPSPLLPVLHTCRNWRMVALPMMFRNGAITLGNKFEFAYNPPEYIACFHTAMNEQYNIHVQHITLSLNLNQAIDGTALNKIITAGYSNFVFSNVAYATIKLTIGEFKLPDYSRAETNVEAFVQQMRSMVPALQNVYISYSALCPFHLQSKPHLSSLVTGICENAHVSDVLISSIEKTIHVNDIPVLSNLCSFHCSWHEEYEGIANIIYANSQTLQKLFVFFHEFAGINALVKNEQTQEYINYPHLYDINFNGFEFLPEYTVPPTENAIIFPRLRYAYIGFEYPFSDDVLFRGNRWRFEGIHMVLNTRAIQCLSTTGVFNPKRPAVIKHILITGRKNMAEDAILGHASRQFFQGVICQAKYLSVQAQAFYSLLIQSIPLDAKYNNVTCLNTGLLAVTFSEIVFLLQRLPNLNVLKSSISRLGDAFNNMSVSQMLEHVRSIFTLPHRSLCIWSVFDINSSTVSLLSCCIFVLADRCPLLREIVFKDSSFITSVNALKRLQSFTKIEMPNTIIPDLTFKHSSVPNRTVIEILHD